MAKRDKILERMKNNPAGWRIGDVEKVAKLYNLEMRRPRGGSSHVIFFHCDYPENISIPDHGEIKRVYIKKLIAFLEKIAK